MTYTFLNRASYPGAAAPRDATLLSRPRPITFPNGHAWEQDPDYESEPA